MASLYLQRKEIVTKNIKIHFTAFGIANICDYVICDRYDGNFERMTPNVDMTHLNSLKHGDRIFLNGSNLQTYYYIINALLDVLLRKNIKLIFFIGIIEPVMDENMIDMLLPHSINIYCTNNNHPSCKILPIGLRDGAEVFPHHENFSGQDILDEMSLKRDKKYWCLLCFSYTSDDRYLCDKILSEKPFVQNLNNNKTLQWPSYGGSFQNESNRGQSINCQCVPQWIFYQYCHESHYTLCPKGWGEDTHRFFEAIALNSIPIVKKTNTPFDETFRIFPCLVVDEWDMCTEEFLKIQLFEKQKQLIEFHAKFPDFLTNTITIQKILDSI
jgi:hypothetical protein